MQAPEPQLPADSVDDSVFDSLDTGKSLEEYAEQRLLNVIEAGAAITPQELLRRIMTNVDSFVGTTPQHDDITCMVVKVE